MILELLRYEQLPTSKLRNQKWCRPSGTSSVTKFATAANRNSSTGFILVFDWLRTRRESDSAAHGEPLLQQGIVSKWSEKYFGPASAVTKQRRQMPRREKADSRALRCDFDAGCATSCFRGGRRQVIIRL
jgi:hypothetical protein